MRCPKPQHNTSNLLKRRYAHSMMVLDNTTYSQEHKHTLDTVSNHTVQVVSWGLHGNQVPHPGEATDKQ